MEFEDIQDAVKFAYRNSRKVAGNFCVLVGSRRQVAEIFLAKGPVRDFTRRWVED